MSFLFITDETVGCGYATISVDGHLDSFPFAAPLSRPLGTFKSKSREDNTFLCTGVGMAWPGHREIQVNF